MPVYAPTEGLPVAIRDLVERARLSHCCYTLVTLLLHCCYTVATLLLHCCCTVVTLVVTLVLHRCIRDLVERAR
jgi:hypothetical protein